LGTTWTDLSVLRAALHWAVRDKKIVKAPFIWLPQPPKDPVLTREEADRLIAAAAHPHLRLFIELALGTGARAGVILELQRSRVYFDKGDNGLIDFRVGEGNRHKRRTVVPMNRTVRAALLEAKATALTDWVIEWGGDRITHVRGGFVRTAARAGLNDVSPHALRHTAGAWMIEEAISLEVIAQFLGHADTKITETAYARLPQTSNRLKQASAAPERGVAL